MPQDDYAEIDLAALSDEELTEQMHNDLYDGMAAEIVEGTNILLSRGWSATRVLDDALVAGMKIVGIDFRDGILFVPEVLLAANAMKAGMAILRPLLAETGAEPVGRVVIGQGREGRRARVGLVAVGPRKSFDVLVGEHLVQEAAGPAVGVGDEDPLVAWPRRADLRPHRGRDPTGSVVQRGGQAGQVDVREPCLVDHRDQLPRQRAAADDQDARRVGRARRAGGRRIGALGSHRRHQAALARRSSMSRRAVSAATPASRQ